MSYPTDAPVRQRIIENIRSTLVAAAPPQTNLKFVDVHVWGGNVLEMLGGWPKAVIVPAVERDDDQAILPLIRTTMDLTLIVGVKDAKWADLIEQLIADVRVALLADWSRGGIAETTQILDREVFDATPTDPVATAQLNLRVIYRTLYKDPSEAH